MKLFTGSCVSFCLLRDCCRCRRREVNKFNSLPQWLFNLLPNHFACSFRICFYWGNDGDNERGKETKCQFKGKIEFESMLINDTDLRSDWLHVWVYGQWSDTDHVEHNLCVWDHPRRRDRENRTEYDYRLNFHGGAGVTEPDNTYT